MSKYRGTLSSSDWIFLGTGFLYCAPLVSRLLLCRLRDADCSILIHHDDPVSSVGSIDCKTQTATREAVVHYPERAKIHFLPNAAASWEALISSPAEEIDLSATGVTKQILGDMTIRSEPYKLPVSGMYHLAAKRFPLDYQIRGTTYRVKTLFPLNYVGRDFPSGKCSFDCRRIRISPNRQDWIYDIHSSRDWSMYSTRGEEDKVPILELCRSDHDGNQEKVLD